MDTDFIISSFNIYITNLTILNNLHEEGNIILIK